MKKTIIGFLKYIRILVILFGIFFLSILFFNFLPLFKIGIPIESLKDILFKLMVPSLFHSLYNSCIISIFLYCIFFLNYQKKNKIIFFLFPIVFSSLAIFLVLYFFKPEKNDINFDSIKDARIYFSPDVFFEHQNDKYFFSDVEEKSIKNVIRIKQFDNTDEKMNYRDIPVTYRNYNNIYKYNNAKVVFLEDKIILELIDSNGFKEKVKFDFQKQSNYNLSNQNYKNSFFNILNNITQKLIYSDNPYINIILWIAVSFFILSLMKLVQIKHNKFLTVIYNFLFLILVYFFFHYMFNYYYKIISDFIAPVIVRQLILSMILILFALIFLGIRIIFFKHHEWEIE